MPENLSPLSAETPDVEDDTTESKTKTKKKAIGALLVKTKPIKKSESFWGGDDEKPDAVEVTALGTASFRRRRSNRTNPEAASDTPDALEPAEQSAAVSELASAHRQEIEQAPQSQTALEQAESVAVLAYLAAVEAMGSIQLGYDETQAAEESKAAELEKVPETNDDIEAALLIKEPIGSEQIITTQVLSEGEIYRHLNTSEVEPPISLPAGPLRSLRVKPTRVLASPLPVILSAARPPSFRAGPNVSGNASPRNIPLTPLFSGMAAPVGPNRLRLPPTALANERRARSEGLLIGAVVGYLSGRRHSRIKTEKRLAPIQQKLERQVRALHSELLQKEDLVRQTVRQRAIIVPFVEAGSVVAATERRPMVLEKPSGHAVPPERIGHVLVVASTRREQNSGPSREAPRSVKPPKVEILGAKKQAETMSRAELLSLSARVSVDGTTLRQIYETQLVSEKGLRRLITEHLRGGNVSRALRRELIEREIDFERDPIMRDKTPKGRAANDRTAKATLTTLLERAGASPKVQSQPIGAVSADQGGKSTEEKNRLLAKKQPQTLIDTAIITLITLLIVIIIMVLMRSR